MPADSSPPSPLGAGALRQLALPAADVERAVTFYRDVLGLRCIAQFGPLAFFDLGGTRLLVEPGERAGEGEGHVLYFAVDDIGAAHTALANRGVVFLDVPHRIHTDDTGTFGPAGEEEWMAFFRDSEGNLLAISSRQRAA
jgi:methylmalonyl-CoA/ethylmalonyl-CoA epimerase